MKTCCLFLLLLLGGCGLLEEKKNFQITSNGIEVANDYVMIDNLRATETEFVLGNEVTYFLNGVSGFSIINDRAFFGASMTVKELKSGSVVLQYDDLFAAKTDGYIAQDASQLNFTLAIGNPMMAGSQYNWAIRVWDKRGSGELTAAMTFSVTDGKDLVGIETQYNGLKPAKVFILSNGSLKSTDVTVGQKLTLFFDDVDGLAVQPDSTVLMGASMSVIDKSGNHALEYSDVFQQNPVVSIAKSKSVTLYLIVGDPMKPGETYLWRMRLWDKNNQKWVESSISLNVLAVE
jgi:hypothetical protein